MVDLSKYKYLWDGSEKGWILERFDRDIVEIEILFDESGPSIEEIKGIRLAIPEYGRRRIKEVIDELRGKRQIRIGEFESIEGRRTAEACDREGLRTNVTVRVETTFLAYNKETDNALVIEDDTVARTVAEEGIRQGMKIEYGTT